MTLTSRLLGFLAITLLLFSCKKERSDEDGKIPGDVESTWKFSTDGTQFSGDMDSAYIQAASTFRALTMVGSRSGNASGEIVIQLVGETINAGSYDATQVAFQYSEGGQILYQRVPGQAGSFTVVITEIDSAQVTGTFGGTAYDTLGQPHVIVEGTFTADLGANSGPDPTEEGVLTVWAEQMCTDGSSIEVMVGDQRGFITEGLTSAPECGDQRAASFSLPQGVYSVAAICGTDTVRYSVTVNTSCVKLLVDMSKPPIEGDYLPLTFGSYWEYNDLNNNAFTHRVTAGADTVLDGRQYFMQTSNLPDTVYYRKDEHVYYEYLTVDFNGSVSNPPTIELAMLHDDYEVGQPWEVSNIPLTLSGIAVNAKFQSQILQKGFSATINGVQYDELIEVQTDLLFSTDQGATYVPASSYVRVFAKGKGIVYYFDLERGTEWGITGLSIVP